MTSTPKPGRERRQGFRTAQHPFVGHLRVGTVSQSRLVFSLASRSGGAAVRSRTKRQLREAFRDASPDLPKSCQVRIAATVDLSTIPRRALKKAAAGILQHLIAQWKASQAYPGPSAGRS